MNISTPSSVFSIFRLSYSTIFLLLPLPGLFSSCIGQTAPPHQAKVEVLSIGEAVSGLDKRITVIYQDQKNNFWFGGDGVYRYDGEELIRFTQKDGLCSHSILSVQEDSLGNLYFDTAEGVSKFDGKKFTTLAIVDTPTSRKDWQLEPNDLWFRMGWDKNGPFRYDGQFLYRLEFPETEQAAIFHAQYPNAPYNPYGIYSMYKDRQGHLWFGTTSLGVCRYDGKNVSWLYEQQLTQTPEGGDFGIRSIIEDQEGYFWFCNTRYRYEMLAESSANNGVHQIQYKRHEGVGQRQENNTLDFPYFMSMTEDNDGALWMATYASGVWKSDGKELIPYPIQSGDTEVLLFTIYKDRQGKLWLGSHNAGVFHYNGTVFEAFKP